MTIVTIILIMDNNNNNNNSQLIENAFHDLHKFNRFLIKRQGVEWRLQDKMASSHRFLLDGWHFCAGGVTVHARADCHLDMDYKESISSVNL